MKEVKYEGLRPKGTQSPRRLWRPGDTVTLEDGLAEELLREPGFCLVVSKVKASKKPKE